MATTIVVKSPPYGTEDVYNALRLAAALLARGEKTHIQLVGDAVVGARKDQETPSGYYNVGGMLTDAISKGATVGI